MIERILFTKRMRHGLTALALLGVIVAPGTAPAFKPENHENLTETELQSRGFDVDSADEVGDSNKYTDVAESSSDAAHADNNMLDAASARLRSKRTEIGDALNACQRRDALDRLGEALHTVQDIYSHSNAVDNDMPIADLFNLSRGEAVCSTPNFAPDGLVTGYFSLSGLLLLRDQCRDMPANMCCHRDLNKDSPTEKNGARHEAALSAARVATGAYLDSLEEDLRARFGEARTAQLVKLLERKQRTLFLVVDDTGSMGNDIDGVKATVNAFLDQVIASDEAPTLGLVTFKDDVNDRGVVCDIEELRAQVNALVASGGGDCPEVSNSGLLAALSHFPLLGSDMQERGGRILLATDASARDASFGPSVAVEAALKGVSIDAILTGDCVDEDGALRSGGDGQSSTVEFDPDARAACGAAPSVCGPFALESADDPLTSVSARTQLRALTEQTGGILFNVARAEVDDVVPTLLDLGRPEVAVIFSRRGTLAAGTPFTALIPVDDTLNQSVTFMITSSTAGTLPAVTLRRPDGSEVVNGDAGVTIRALSSVLTFVVQAPAIGSWQVTLAGQGAFNLRASGATSFQLNSLHLQTEAPELLRPELDLVPLGGQPFVGDELTADLRYTDHAQAVTVSLRRPDGTLLTELAPVTPLDLRRFRTGLTIPGEPFVVETTGRTAAGADFVRQVSLPAVPQTVSLLALPSSLTAPPGVPSELGLRVRNAGSADATFRLMADPELPWDLFGPETVTVPAGGVVEVPITVVVPTGTIEATNNAITFFAEDVATPRVRNSTSFTAIAGSTNRAPDCSGAAAEPDRLWPPSGWLQTVTIAGVTDPDGDPVSLTITSITQDEPVFGKGAGHTSPDAEGVGTDTASVRSERLGKGDGRVYEIKFDADDGRGGRCSGAVTVGVPRTKHGTPIDSGQNYDSTVSGKLALPRSPAASGRGLAWAFFVCAATRVRPWPRCPSHAQYCCRVCCPSAAGCPADRPNGATLPSAPAPRCASS